MHSATSVLRAIRAGANRSVHRPPARPRSCRYRRFLTATSSRYPGLVTAAHRYSRYVTGMADRYPGLVTATHRYSRYVTGTASRYAGLMTAGHRYSHELPPFWRSGSGGTMHGDGNEPICPARPGKFSGPCRAFADRLFSNTFRPKRTELTGFRRAAPRDNFLPEPAMRSAPRECFASWLPFLATAASQEILP
jgi:hypothetical protein